MGKYDIHTSFCVLYYIVNSPLVKCVCMCAHAWQSCVAILWKHLSRAVFIFLYQSLLGHCWLETSFYLNFCVKSWKFLHSVGVVNLILKSWGPDLLLGILRYYIFFFFWERNAEMNKSSWNFTSCRAQDLLSCLMWTKKFIPIILLGKKSPYCPEHTSAHFLILSSAYRFLFKTRF